MKQSPNLKGLKQFNAWILNVSLEEVHHFYIAQQTAKGSLSSTLFIIIHPSIHLCVQHLNNSQQRTQKATKVSAVQL